MDAPNKLVYQVRDLITRSVTLSPNRAQVVREVKDVPLRPNTQITIIGLSPTVDEQSIRVEGIGAAAIITDMVVEHRPNRDIFADCYPEFYLDEDSDEDSEDESGSEDDSHSDKHQDDASDPKKDLEKRLVLLGDEARRVTEGIESASARLKMLDSYNTLLTHENSISDAVSTYRTERDTIFQDHMNGLIKEREISAQIADLTKKLSRLRAVETKKGAKARKEKAKAQRAKEKEKRKDLLRKAEAAREKQRLRREKESFWPKNVYVVKLSLDPATSFTPSSSRRSSVSSDLVKLAVESPASNGKPTGTCDLRITYVTSYAYWTPTYDLTLSTTTNTGTLYFDAKLTNQTSETWNDCKVILSTSQAEFSDLKDEVPTLTPWTIRLANKNVWRSGNDILYSREEQAKKAELKARKDAIELQKPHRNLFGVNHPHVGGPEFGVPPAQTSGFSAPSVRKKSAASNAFGVPSAPSGGLFGAPPAPSQGGGGLFGNAAAQNQAPAAAAGLFGSAVPRAAQASAPPPAPGGFGSAAPERNTENMELKEGVKMAKRSSSVTGGLLGSLRRASQPAGPQDGRVYEAEVDESIMDEDESDTTFQESSFEELGLTSTYDLPGQKTLTPSATASKQRVATIAFTSVTFSRTIVAKYRPAAYLQARLRNGARMTLLPGPAGLTLDDCFLGRSALPRCSPGDTFKLSLGIDPAILVAYPKPEVRRSQSGILTREDSQVYTRTITLTNTRAGGDEDTEEVRTQPVSLTVLDQIPVSEDERLRIDVLQPRGLVLEGAGVTTGAAGSRDGRKIENEKTTASKEDKDWGKAMATLKKGGEVSWDVSLNAGRTVKLMLEYECACRTGEHAVNA